MTKAATRKKSGEASGKRRSKRPKKVLREHADNIVASRNSVDPASDAPLPAESRLGATCALAEAKSKDSAWQQTLHARRQRQASVASILDSMFGPSAQCDPDLWERRAYLMLVGLLYEKLATEEDEITTDELVKLAKALAEHRKIDAWRLQTQKKRIDEPSANDANGPLPDQFADAVRQVYGIRFPALQADPSAERDQTTADGEDESDRTLESMPARKRQ